MIPNRMTDITTLLTQSAEKTLNMVMIGSAVLNLFFTGFMSHLFKVMSAL